MASELSRFIEDELKRQGINDDEEQRLLIRSRVKPLAVQSAGQSAAGAWTNKQRVILGACLLVAFLGLVLLVTSVRNSRAAGGSWTGAITEPEAGTLPLAEQPKSPAAASPTQHDTQPVHEKEVEGPDGDDGEDIDEYPPGEQQGGQPDAAGGMQQGDQQEQPQPSPSPSPPAAASPEQPSSSEAVPAPAAGSASPAASPAPVAPSPVPSPQPSPAPAAANATGAGSPPAEAAPAAQSPGEGTPSEQPPAPMEGNSEGDSTPAPQGDAPEGAAPAPAKPGDRRLLRQRQA